MAIRLDPVPYVGAANDHAARLVSALSGAKVNHYQLAYSSQALSHNLEAAWFTTRFYKKASFFKNRSIQQKLKTIKTEAKEVVLGDLDYITADDSPEAKRILFHMQRKAVDLQARVVLLSNEIISELH